MFSFSSAFAPLIFLTQTVALISDAVDTKETIRLFKDPTQAPFSNIE